MDLERREIQFSGHVQGVGFRYTTARIASNHDVTGTVKNLPDGRVRLVIEGRRGEIAAVIASLQQAMSANITDVDTTTEAYTNEFEDFQILR